MRINVSRHSAPNRAQGFTLLELMAVLVIVSILTAIALPAYARYVRNAQRTAVEAQMLKLAGDLERWRGKTLSYAGFTPENGYQTIANNIPNTVILTPKNAIATKFAYQIVLVDSCRTTSLITPTTGCSGLGWVMIARPFSNDLTDTATPTGKPIMATASRLVMNSQGIRCMTPNTIPNSSIINTAISDASLCGSSSTAWQ